MWKEGLWALGFAMVGCSSALNPGSGADAGVAPAPGDAGSVPSGATGAGCGQDPTTGAILCTGISLCPQLVIDSSTFPDCGFRIHGDAIDLECVCSGSLCPAGSPATCDQAAQLLARLTEGTICAQVSDGLCVTPAGGGSPGGGVPSGCDPTCRTQCAGDPNCVQGCGC